MSKEGQAGEVDFVLVAAGGLTLSPEDLKIDHKGTKTGNQSGFRGLAKSLLRFPGLEGADK